MGTITLYRTHQHQWIRKPRKVGQAGRLLEGDRLAQAIAATFARRETAIPEERPDALTPAFAADDNKQTQWRAFIEDLSQAPGGLAEVVEDIAAFLVPHAAVAAKRHG